MAHLLWLEHIYKDDADVAGTKAAGLGEMIRAGFPVPNGFCLTTSAYETFIVHNRLEKKISEVLSELNVSNPTSLQSASSEINALFSRGLLPETLASEIIKSYHTLSGIQDTEVAVRSSAVVGRLSQSQFAGQYATLLNVSSEANLIESVKKVWASLYSPQAILFRKQQGLKDFGSTMAVVIQKMVKADASGVMFTLDPLTGDKSILVIEAVWGLGEAISQGSVTPDRYVLSKNPLLLASATVTPQAQMLEMKAGMTRLVPVSKKMQTRAKLSHGAILKLADIGLKLQSHFFFPQDVEWAIEGNTIFLLQTRPATRSFREPREVIAEITQPSSNLNLKLILRATPASPGIASGRAVLVKTVKDLTRVKKGDIVVASDFSKDCAKVLYLTHAIVAETGGLTSDAAILAREHGLPAVLNALNATKLIKDKSIVTVNGSSGEIFSGSARVPTISTAPFSKEIDAATAATPEPPIKTATELYLTVTSVNDIHDKDVQEASGAIVVGTETYEQERLRILEKAAQAFLPKPVIYIPPKNITLDLFERDLEVIKSLRHKQKLTNLSLSLRALHPLALLETKKFVTSIGLHPGSTFHIYLIIDTPAQSLEFKRYLEAGIQGVLIDTASIIALMEGHTREKSPVSAAALWVIEKVVSEAHGAHLKTVTLATESQAADTVEKLIQHGIGGIGTTPAFLPHLRELVHFHESRIGKH